MWNGKIGEWTVRTFEIIVQSQLIVNFTDDIDYEIIAMTWHSLGQGQLVR